MSLPAAQLERVFEKPPRGGWGWRALIWTLSLALAGACEGREHLDGEAFHGGAHVVAPGGATGPTPARPARIISTMPSTTEMLHTFGLWESVVGVSIFCDVPAEARDLPKIGSGMDPDVERMLALRPDVVVGSVIQEGYAFVRTLERAGVTVELVRDQGLEELLDDMPRFGHRLGAGERAEAVAEDIRNRLAQLAAATAGLQRPRVLLVYDRDPYYAAGPDTFANGLLQAAGGRNALDRGAWVQLDREAVIALAPDVIFEPLDRGQPDPLESWSALSTVPAVRNGRIFGLREPGAARPGAGVAAAAEEMARHLFPTRFPANDRHPPPPEAHSNSNGD